MSLDDALFLIYTLKNIKKLRVKIQSTACFLRKYGSKNHFLCEKLLQVPRVKFQQVNGENEFICVRQVNRTWKKSRIPCLKADKPCVKKINKKSFSNFSTSPYLPLMPMLDSTILATLCL